MIPSLRCVWFDECRVFFDYGRSAVKVFFDVLLDAIIHCTGCFGFWMRSLIAQDCLDVLDFGCFQFIATILIDGLVESFFFLN